MASKAEKRRAKKAAKAHAKAAGGKRAIEAQQEALDHASRVRVTVEDVRKVVEDARRRHLAAKKDADMNDPMLGCETGRAIRLACPKDEDAAPLWRTWCDMDAASETYHRVVIGKTRFPSVAKVEYLAEVFEVRPDSKIDLRTPDEKAAHAKRAWLEWCVRMDRLPAVEHTALHMALWRRVRLRDKDKLTGAGRMAVAALQKMST